MTGSVGTRSMRAMVLASAGQAARARPSSRTRAAARARCCCACSPAASAAPTCTSSTASSRSPKLPLVPGHQIVGEVGWSAAARAGDRVGVPWLGWTCGECRYCRAGRENLCDRARFTGYDLDGGYAELCVADERFCFPIPDGYPDLAGGAAPVRRADRLPVAPARGRRREARALRLRRRRAHRLPGRACAGAARCSPLTRAG